MNAPARRPPVTPGAQLLFEQNDQIRYRCYCGREALTGRESWDRGIHHCNCTGKRIPFPTHDLVGERFHRLTVTAWAGKPDWDGVTPGRYSQQYWHATCDCGQEFCLPVKSVKCGKTPSCLCQANATVEPKPLKGTRHIAADLSGQQFSELTVLHRVPRGERKTHSAIWLCQCACGNTKEVGADNLTLGRVRSCGCLRRGPKGNRAANNQSAGKADR